jgi:hypothetical protein
LHQQVQSIIGFHVIASSVWGNYVTEEPLEDIYEAILMVEMMKMGVGVMKTHLFTQPAPL